MEKKIFAFALSFCLSAGAFAQSTSTYTPI